MNEAGKKGLGKSAGFRLKIGQFDWNWDKGVKSGFGKKLFGDINDRPWSEQGPES